MEKLTNNYQICLYEKYTDELDDYLFERTQKELDVFSATAEQIASLANELKRSTVKESSLLINPALTELAVRIPERNSVIKFIEVAVHETENINISEDEFAEITPQVYAVEYANQFDDGFALTSICSAKIVNEKRVIQTATKAVPVAENGSIDLFTNENLTEYCKLMKTIYLAIQYGLTHRPEIFSTKEITRTKKKHEKGPDGRRHTVNVIKLVKRIVINDEKLNTQHHEVSHKECPCWGVIGHWRHYKSGMEIWIKPHRKGKERNNPDAYISKKYELWEA